MVTCKTEAGWLETFRNSNNPDHMFGLAMYSKLISQTFIYHNMMKPCSMDTQKEQLELGTADAFRPQ